MPTDLSSVELTLGKRSTDAQRVADADSLDLGNQGHKLTRHDRGAEDRGNLLHLDSQCHPAFPRGSAEPTQCPILTSFSKRSQNASHNATTSDTRPRSHPLHLAKLHLIIIPLLPPTPSIMSNTIAIVISYHMIALEPSSTVTLGTGT